MAHQYLGGSVPFSGDACSTGLQVEDAAEAIVHALEPGSTACSTSRTPKSRRPTRSVRRGIRGPGPARPRVPRRDRLADEAADLGGPADREGLHRRAGRSTPRRSKARPARLRGVQTRRRPPRPAGRGGLLVCCAAVQVPQCWRRVRGTHSSPAAPSSVSASAHSATTGIESPPPVFGSDAAAWWWWSRSWSSVVVHVDLDRLGADLHRARATPRSAVHSAPMPAEGKSKVNFVTATSMLVARRRRRSPVRSVTGTACFGAGVDVAAALQRDLLAADLGVERVVHRARRSAPARCRAGRSSSRPARPASPAFVARSR